MKDVKLTPELKKKLEGFLPITPQPDFDFTPKIYEQENVPVDLRPVFRLRPPRGADQVSSAYYDRPRYTIEIFKKSVIGWKNYLDAEGNEVEFKEEYRAGGELSDEIIDRFPNLLILELAVAAIQATKLTEEEKTGLK